MTFNSIELAKLFICRAGYFVWNVTINSTLREPGAFDTLTEFAPKGTSGFQSLPGFAGQVNGRDRDLRSTLRGGFDGSYAGGVSRRSGRG